jgi:hypothetical protein
LYVLPPINFPLCLFYFSLFFVMFGVCSIDWKMVFWFWNELFWLICVMINFNLFNNNNNNDYYDFALKEGGFNIKDFNL